MEDNILYMERFCGMEEYPLKDSIWYILKGDGTEYDPDQLYLEINFEKAIRKSLRVTSRAAPRAV